MRDDYKDFQDRVFQRMDEMARLEEQSHAAYKRKAEELKAIAGEVGLDSSGLAAISDLAIERRLSGLEFVALMVAASDLKRSR